MSSGNSSNPSAPTIITKFMGKKFLIISLIIIVILLLGIFAYKYYNQGAKVQNTTGGANIEVKEPEGQKDNTAQSQQAQVEIGGIKANASGGKGTLIICMEKCGDNVCQKSDSDICSETPEDCPQDCKN